MDLDPVETVKGLQDDEDEGEDEDRDAARKHRENEKRASDAKHKLNTLIAITVAILATFMGVCKVKDDNICQAMQQSQANKIDNWNFYQARNIRQEIANATVAQLELQALNASVQSKPAYVAKISEYRKLAKEQEEKKGKVKADAEGADKDYNDLNYRDDQFDLSDTLLAISISLLAMTALTQKKWLYGIALIPTFFGVLMGLAGLFGWHLHSDLLAKWLGT